MLIMNFSTPPGTWSSARGQLCAEGGTTGGAYPRQTFCVCHRQSWHRQDQDPALPEPYLPQHEAQAHLAGPQPQSRHQR